MLPAEELLIGAHISIAGGVHNALLRGQEIGATTMQIFTANQRQWNGKPISEEELSLWHKAVKESKLKKIMSHDSYLINLGSPVAEGLEKSRKTFKEELHRCQQLDLAFLNFHPGSAVGRTEEECLECIVESLEELAPVIQKGKTRLLVECTAGQGSSVGHRFEHLGFIVSRLHDKIPIGVCLDTCHLFAAGYDIRTRSAWGDTLSAFDKAVGFKHLYAFHLNDSVKPLGSKVDRHAQLGKGQIGLGCFEFLMQDADLRELPKYLETPDPTLWKDEITLLRSLAK